MRLIRDGEKGGKGVWRWGKTDSFISYELSGIRTTRLMVK